MAGEARVHVLSVEQSRSPAAHGTQYLRIRTSSFGLVLISNSTVAEGQGFEPWNPLRGYTLSQRAP